jgi:hypothetical protein
MYCGLLLIFYVAEWVFGDFYWMFFVDGWIGVILWIFGNVGIPIGFYDAWQNGYCCWWNFGCEWGAVLEFMAMGFDRVDEWFLMGVLGGTQIWFWVGDLMMLVVNYWFEKSLSWMKLFECYKYALRLEFSKGLIYRLVLICECGYVV